MSNIYLKLMMVFLSTVVNNAKGFVVRLAVLCVAGFWG